MEIGNYAKGASVIGTLSTSSVTVTIRGTVGTGNDFELVQFRLEVLFSVRLADIHVKQAGTSHHSSFDPGAVIGVDPREPRH